MNFNPSMNLVKEMENRTIKIYSVNAVILALREKIPTRRQVQLWKKYDIMIVLIHPVNGLVSSQRDYSELRTLIDLEYFMEDGAESSSDADHFFIGSALERLKVPPGKSVLLTDDPQYVRIAAKKNLAMIIGIRELESKRNLYREGANIVVDKLKQVLIFGGNHSNIIFSQTLPNLFSRQQKFTTVWDQKKPVFFFDYDGTLTPIVRNPDLAALEEDMRVLLKEISHIYQVTVISGRDMDDIKRFVNLDSIIYAGSHGFRISGPDGLYMEHEEGRKLLSRLDELETVLRSKMEKEIEGIQIERKRYAIAIHYRNVDTKKIPRIIKIVNNMMDSYSEFSKGKGKKILEVKPTADWHKGKAVQWILAELGLSSSGGYLPVYVGDDITDEDAFRTVADEGLGILVGDHGQPTAARYQLKNVKQVKQFLHYVIHAYKFTKK